MEWEVKLQIGASVENVLRRISFVELSQSTVGYRLVARTTSAWGGLRSLCMT